MHALCFLRKHNFWLVSVQYVFCTVFVHHAVLCFVGAVCVLQWKLKAALVQCFEGIHTCVLKAVLEQYVFCNGVEEGCSKLKTSVFRHVF